MQNVLCFILHVQPRKIIAKNGLGRRNFMALVQA